MNRIGILDAVVMALLFAGLRPTALDAADNVLTDKERKPAGCSSSMASSVCTDPPCGLYNRTVQVDVPPCA